MSEAKKKRSVQEIQQEYSGLCMRAGHTQYQIATLEKELALVNESLRDLNFEAAAAQQAEAEVKKAAEGASSEVKANG